VNHPAPSLPAGAVRRRWSCASGLGVEGDTSWWREAVLEHTVSGPDTASAAGCRSTSATPLDLTERAVHLWWARLDGTPPLSSRELAAILSPEERRRADAFLARRDRQRFIVRRCLLRQLLAGYVGGTPHDVALATGPNGRPELTTATSTIGDLCFSCSHSRGLAQYGFTRGRRIGVDVEAVRPIPELPWIVEEHFARDERQWVAARSGSDRLAAFFAVWTCKEAVAKALGDGLTRPLVGIQVDVWTGPTPTLRALHGDGTAAAGWTLGLRRFADAWLAAVAVERPRSDETGRRRDDRSDVDGATHQGATRWSTPPDSMTAHASGDVPGSASGARNRRPPARHRP
jgi:4'-phosphopantetheinyl transferase